MPLLKPGQELAGYRIIAYHSRGGMGEVYRAVQISVGREVALKLLSPEMMRKNPEFARDFVAEARSAGNLNHPNIIAVHDVGRVKIAGSDDSLFYFSMEFVDGEDLRSMLKQKGKLSTEEVGRYLPGVIDALAYGEARHMVHRDIKPENIMVAKNGLVKLADFGIALQRSPEIQEQDEKRLDEQGRAKVMGTPRYMSPEQARARPVDSRSDQYSLGATLFHLLTGEPPFQRKNSKELMRAHVFDPVPDPSEIADIPAVWADLCMKMMAKDPGDRYRNMTRLREAVLAAMEGKSRRRAGAMRNPPDTDTDTGRPAWIPIVTAGGIGVVVLVIGIAVFLLVQSDPAESDGQERPTNGDRSVSSDIKVSKAQDLIAGLPAEPEEAITVINGPEGLGNPYFGRGPARQVLIQHRNDVLLRELKDQRDAHRKELLDKLAKAREHIQAETFGAAEQIIRSFSTDDRDILGGEFETVQEGLDRLGKRIEEACHQRILTADAPTVIDTALTEADAAGLGKGRLRRLHDIAERRREELHKAEEESLAERRKLDRLYWENLLKQTNAARSSASSGRREPPALEALRATVADRLESIRTPEVKRRTQGLLAMVERATTVMQAVRTYLDSGTAKVFTEVGAIQPTSYEADTCKIHYKPSDKRILSAAYRIYDDKINWLLLAKDALHRADIERPQQELLLAAYFWFWRSHHAANFIEQTSKHQQTLIMQEMDNGNGINVGEILLGLKRLHRDFGRAETEPPPAARGEEFTRNETALTWETTATMDLTKKGSEDLFHTGLDWDCGSKNFTRGEIRFRVADRSRLLIGFARGERRVRLGLDRASGMIAGIVTGADGAPAFDPASRSAEEYDIDLAAELTLQTVFHDGTVDLALNGTPVIEGAVLPTNGPLRLLLQSSQYKQGQRTRVDIHEVLLE